MNRKHMKQIDVLPWALGVGGKAILLGRELGIEREVLIQRWFKTGNVVKALPCKQKANELPPELQL